MTFKSNARRYRHSTLSAIREIMTFMSCHLRGYELLTEKIPVHVDDTMPTVRADNIENSRQKLAIEIKKQEEGSKKPLAGAVFEIRNEKTNSHSSPQLILINENGEVTVEVPAGNQTYTVTEIKAPEGYVLGPSYAAQK